MQTVERSITDIMYCEVDNNVGTVKTRVHEAIVAAVDNLVIPRVELAIKSVSAASGWDTGGVVIDPDQRSFSGNI